MNPDLIIMTILIIFALGVIGVALYVRLKQDAQAGCLRKNKDKGSHADKNKKARSANDKNARPNEAHNPSIMDIMKNQQQAAQEEPSTHPIISVDNFLHSRQNSAEKS